MTRLLQQQALSLTRGCRSLSQPLVAVGTVRAARCQPSSSSSTYSSAPWQYNHAATAAAAAWGWAPCYAQRRGVVGSVACCSTPHHVSWLASVEVNASADGNAPGTTSNGNGGGLAAGNPKSCVRGALAIAALQRQQLDAVVMLAGGLLPDGGLPEWVTRRLDTAYDVHLLQGRCCPVLLLGALKRAEEAPWWCRGRGGPSHPVVASEVSAPYFYAPL
jgi:hypothetical protein